MSENHHISHKVRSLLTQIGLENRIIGDQSVRDLYGAGVDYEEPRAALKSMSGEARDFLKGAIKIAD